MKATVLVASFLLAIVGCSSETNSGSSGDEQDVKASSCAPITTLTCASGFKSTTDGCPQPTAPAAASVPRGRCVPIDSTSTDSCAPITTLTCASGFKSTTDGCTQPTAPAAASVPKGRCVPIEDDSSTDGCGPITTLTCQAGFEPTTAGCKQPTAPAAASLPKGRCVSVDVKKFVGTFTNPEGTENDTRFFSYGFAADGTYKATGGCRPNPNGPSCFAITGATGTWSIDKSGPQLGAPGGLPELVLVDSFNQKDTFFYSFDGNKLSLKTTVNGKESIFVKQ
jgi:hypothetical protein